MSQCFRKVPVFDYLVYGKILVVSVHFHLNDVNSTSSSPSSSTSTVPPISTTELEFKEESKRSEPRQELNSTATTPTSNKAPNGQLVPNWVLLILCCLALVGLFGLGILGLTCYWTIKKNLENLRTGNNKVDMEADNKATGVRKG